MKGKPVIENGREVLDVSPENFRSVYGPGRRGNPAGSFYIRPASAEERAEGRGCGTILDIRTYPVGL